jgi:hypothetical protein
MTASLLLDRLEGVRQAGEGRWLARCPSHEDRSPSLSIRETGDGTVLIHDFAGCSPADILAAVGLELKDLFPEPLTDHRKGPRRDLKHVHAAREALKVLATEATVLQIAADHLARGDHLDDGDRERLALAAERIRTAREWAA